MVCEFSQPVNGAFRKVYTEYLMRSLPPIARKVSSNPESYVYLAESIQAWPAQRELAERIAAAGWGDVGWRNLTGGIVALHRAAKPSLRRLSADWPPGADSAGVRLALLVTGRRVGNRLRRGSS